MSEEWFKEDKDLKAGVEDFLEIFKDIGKNPNNKVLNNFTENFVFKYQEVYNQFERDKSRWVNLPPYDKDRPFVEINRDFINNLIFTPDIGVLFSKNDQKSLEEVARHLGWLLGTFLGIVEYIFCSEEWGHKIACYLNKKILIKSESIVDNLKEIHKSVKLKFIANRVENISQKHKNKLTPEQKKLLSDIAIIFSS